MYDRNQPAWKLLIVALLIHSALLVIVTESPGIAAPSTAFEQTSPRGALSDVLLTASSPIYFGTLPPHSALPSEATCAQSVPKSSWEPRPENTAANHQKPTLAQLTAFYANPLNFIDGPPASDFQAVDGNYAGTTDMIIRWAACKWGLDENVLRAQAFEESTWSAYTTGDFAASPLSCAAGLWNGWQGTGYCYQSYGITQMKMMSFNAWPAAWNSTSFNLDFRGAYWRACMNGDVSYYYDQVPTSGYPTYPNGNTSQMSWGCIGSWFSGSWYDSAALSYIATIQTLNNSKPWQALPSGTSSSLTLLSPASGSTISGMTTINIGLDQNDPRACYACLSIDGVHQTCTPAIGPWTWNTDNYVLNGHHAIQVDAYTCSGTGPNYHVGAMVTVAN